MHALQVDNERLKRSKRRPFQVGIHSPYNRAYLKEMGEMSKDELTPNRLYHPPQGWGKDEGRQLHTGKFC